MWRLLALISLLVMAAPARAADLGPLRAEAARLAAALAEVRHVELAQYQDSAARTAALEARLARMEETLRQLTGRIEEAEYAQQRLSQRMERLVADIDARLQAAESSRTTETGRAEAPPAAEEPEAVPAPAPVARPTPAAPPPRQQQTAAAPAAPSSQAPVEPDEAARRGYVLGTLPQDVLRNLPAPANVPDLPAPGQGDARQQARVAPGTATGYEAGLELLQARQWSQAEQAFTSFVQNNPDDPRAPTASYWIGETHFFRRDYPTAAAVFARNYRTYGENAPRAPDNLLKLGMSLAALGDKTRACLTFAELAKRHPNAPAAVRQQLSRERAAADCS